MRWLLVAAGSALSSAGYWLAAVACGWLAAVSTFYFYIFTHNHTGFYMFKSMVHGYSRRMSRRRRPLSRCQVPDSARCLISLDSGLSQTNDQGVAFSGFEGCDRVWDIVGVEDGIPDGAMVEINLFT